MPFLLGIVVNFIMVSFLYVVETPAPRQEKGKRGRKKKNEEEEGSKSQKKRKKDQKE